MIKFSVTNDHDAINFHAGSGKTHYIRKQLNSAEFHDGFVVQSVDETFDKLECIRQLKKISHVTCNIALYLNISLILSKVMFI